MWARRQERLEAEAQAKAQEKFAKIVREAALYRELVASGAIKEPPA
jgi:replicative DNA helicase